jgi:hypothetical protein
MNSDENKSSIFGMSFLDIQKQEKEKEKKKKQAEYAKKYYNKPEVKARNTALRQTKVHEERMAKMDQDQHVICKKLGKSIAHSRRYLDYSFKCTNCEVSYSKKDQNQFFRKISCPCCHYKLRIRKTVEQKKKIVLEQSIEQKKEQTPLEQINQNTKNNESLIQETKPLKKCPSCGKIVFSRDKLETEFGFRKMGNKTRPQSWCRTCRTTKSA